jgi:hypothetical protein
LKEKSLLLALLLIAVPLALGAHAFVQETEVENPKQDQPAPEGKGSQGSKEKVANRKQSPEERWADMTEGERKVLRERFDALREMSPEDRAALKQRAAELEKQRHDYEEGLNPELRKELGGLPLHERTRILRDHQIAQHRRAGEELRESLDEGPRHLVEEMFDHHKGKPRPSHSMRDELRDEFGEKVVKRFGEAGQLTAEEERHLMSLSSRERLVRALTVERKHIEELVLKVGLPKGVSEKKWEKIKAEPSVESFLKKCRKAGLGEHFGLGPHQGGKPGGRSPELDGPRPVGATGVGDSPPNVNEREHANKAKATSKEGVEIRELGDMLRPSLADRLAFKGLPREERRVKMDGQLRARAEAFLEGRAWFPEKSGKSLKGLSNSEFIEHMRKFVHESRGLDRRASGKGEKSKPDRRERKADDAEVRRSSPPEDGRRSPR